MSTAQLKVSVLFTKSYLLVLEEWNEEEITALADSIQAKDEKVQLEAVTKLKNLLVKSNFTQLEVLVEKVVSAGILGHLAQIIKSTEDFLIKFHAMWCFVNICCGNSSHVSKALDTGVLDLVFKIIDGALVANPIDQNHLDLTVECVWLLGNIAGDVTEHRDTCLEQHAADKIVLLARKFPDHEKLIEHSSWALQNFVSKKPSPFWNQISESFKWLLSIIQDNKYPSKVVYYALWGICYISSSYPLDVVDSGSIPTLVQYLGSSENKLIFPALQTLGNLLSSTKDHYTDEVLKQPAFIDLLFKLSNSDNERIKIYATWSISNIAAGSPDQISKIIDNPEYINILNDKIKGTDEKIRYQASCALANLVFRASVAQIESLVTNNNYLEGLLEMMKQPDLRVYERNIVEPINTIFKYDSQKKFAPIFKQKGLVEQMQNVANGFSFEMRSVANDVINKNFINIQQPAPTTISSTPLLTAPKVTFAADTKASPAASPSKEKEKVPKAAASKKIKKPTKPKKTTPKKLIRRTKSMIETLKEAKSITKGVRGKRTRKSTRPTDASSNGKVSKMRRTNTMKQTLEEAKKIMKQLDSATKRTKTSAKK